MFKPGKKTAAKENIAPSEMENTEAGEPIASSAETEEAKSQDLSASITESTETETLSSSESDLPPATDPESSPAPIEPKSEVEAGAVPLCMSDRAKRALSSDDFHNFIAEKVLNFLSVMDIQNPGERRAAVISYGLDEEGIRARLDLAVAFLRVQTEYGKEKGLTSVIEEAQNYSVKLTAMKQWLTIR